MLIGEDFEKIAWKPFGLDLVEPNTMLGDGLIFVVSIYIWFLMLKTDRSTPFFKNWTRFFFVFSITFLIGGFGHLFYNYLGLNGKYPSLYLGLLTTYFIEQAMLSIHPNHTWKKRLLSISKWKLFAAFIASTIVFIVVDLEPDPSRGLHVTTINTSIGLIFSLGVLGYHYSLNIDSSFKYFWWSVLLMFPTILFQVFKINIHPWFDRNDASHLLLIIGAIFYYQGVKGYEKRLSPYLLTVR